MEPDIVGASATAYLDRLTSALAGRYRIVRAVGAGGMATVYLAHDEKHDRDVAIKVLHPDLGAALGGERFLSEIKTTARLQHPHILPLLDSGVGNGLLYYVMPFVSGETLRARLERERLLPVDDAVRIAREVAGALGAAHDMGIVHRDIKPENILLQGGHALVADFGIALAVQTAGGHRMTQTGLSLGTPHYMSPEQAMGERTIDARADLYALGAVTYEMLVGEAPFTGPTVQAVVARVLSEEPRPLVSQRKAIPEAVEYAVLRALEKLPADRFESAGAFAEAMVEQGERSTRARRAEVNAPRRSRALVSAIGAALLMAAVAGWGWIRPTAPAPVVRYVLSVDSTTLLRDWTGEIAISPDGSTIGYGGGLSGPLRLRKRDAVGFTAVPGTEGATSPCFSPDNKQVAFWRNGTFVVMSLAERMQAILAESLDAPSSCSWGDDGYLYREAMSGNVWAIVRMKPVAGSSIEPIATPDTTVGEWSLLLPEALPNGKGVLFTVQYRDGRSSIVASDLSGRRSVVMARAARARYARNGEMLYTTMDGRLWSVPFDQDRLQVTGDPIAVGEGVPGTMVGPSDFAVSASGTVVHALDNSGGQSDLVMVTRNGREEAVDTSWHGDFASPALSGDGARLAVSVSVDGQSEIWTRRLAGGSPQKHTMGGSSYQDPSFTPDGRSLSFTSYNGNESKTYELLTLSLAGGGKAMGLLGSARAISEHAWSPVGGAIAVRTTTTEDGAGDILVGAPGSSPTMLEPVVASSRSEYSPSISPDGRYMAYASNESGRFEIYVVPFPRPDGVRWPVTTGGGRAPRWGRTGREIFYIDLSSNLVAASVTVLPTFGVQGRSVLFNAAPYSILAISRHSFDVMPDDQRFLMVRRRGGATTAQLTVVENWAAEARGVRKGR